jgi:hypothetical protein
VEKVRKNYLLREKTRILMQKNADCGVKISRFDAKKCDLWREKFTIFA